MTILLLKVNRKVSTRAAKTKQVAETDLSSSALGLTTVVTHGINVPVPN